MDDTTMTDPDESLVTRRSRRSTAGNRMAAALAEMALDIAAEPVEDDVDFVNDKDEEDVFGSDFESTDEEAAQEDAEAGDRVVQEEEKRARKDARSRLERTTAAAHAKNKVTFNPQAQPSTTMSKPKDLKRRVSLGVAVNAETGEVLTVDKASPRKKRHSQRKHTILNTSATVKRMKRSEEKKAATPKKMKTETKTLSQTDLIKLALDNEGGNIIEHRDYLKNEEEKRRRARVVRATVQGPLLRWISKGEETKVLVPPPPVSSVIPMTPRPPYAYSYITSGPTSYGQNSPYTYSAGITPQTPGMFGSTMGYTAGTPFAPATTPIASSSSQAIPPPTQYQPTNFNPYLTQLQSTPSTPPTWTPPAPLPPIERIEKVTKNYVIHELSQYEGVPKPLWNETMTAMFGDHVKWDELRVYIGKGRPLSRPKQVCPITGKPAKYVDPRTGVPYADLRSYQVLTSILGHEFVWSPALKCYVGRREQPEQESDAGSTMII